ncbi:MAG: hypothetical protein FWD82_01555 [Defluviitaleaceae bacterium]|nr:hypothetical protein [Defluviitaleaceae bacterium]
MKKKILKLISFSLALALLFQSTTTIFATDSIILLEDDFTYLEIDHHEEIVPFNHGVFSTWVPNIRQENNVWCWAAASVAMLQTRGIHTTQRQFAQFAIWTLPLERLAFTWEAANGISAFGVHNTIINRNLNGSELVNEISAHRPVYARRVRGGAVSHVYVISTVDTFNFDWGLAMMDPWVGSHITFSLSAFTIDPWDSHTRWADTIVLR